MNTTHLRKLTAALTVPALAGLLVAGGCDDRSDDATVTGTTPPAGTDGTMGTDDTMTTDGDDMMDRGANTVEGMAGNDSAALAAVPDSVIESLTNMSQTAAEKAEVLNEQAQDGTDIPGYGSGEAASNQLKSINEAFDALKGGIEDRNFAEVSSSLTSLKGMNLQGELKTQFDGIMTAMKNAKIPGLGM